MISTSSRQSRKLAVAIQPLEDDLKYYKQLLTEDLKILDV